MCLSHLVQTALWDVSNGSCGRWEDLSSIPPCLSKLQFLGQKCYLLYIHISFAACSLFKLVSFSQHNAFEIQIIVVINILFLLFLSNISLYGYTTVCLFVHSVKAFGLFLGLAFTNNVAIKTDRFLCEQKFSFLQVKIQEWDPGSYSKYTFNCIRNCEAAYHSDCSTSHSPQQTCASTGC